MNQPLVSVVVITYNSSKYIIDGLESVKAQTYPNIELIISDDCSTDNTVAICQKWLEDNAQHFTNKKLITTDKNTGVAGNLNRGIKVSYGEWIKVLSGDDKFFPHTIERYVEFAFNNPQAEIIFGKLHIYGPDKSLVKECKDYYENVLYPKINLPQREQYIENLKSLFVPGPGLFYKKSLWSLIGGFDERYQFCEEDPFMFKIYKANKKVYFLNQEVYYYQVLNGSLGRENKILPRPIADRIRFFRDYRWKEMLKTGLLLYLIDEGLNYKLIETKNIGKSGQYIGYRILQLFSPIKYIKFFSRHLKGK